jgi:hypothetical protein
MALVTSVLLAAGEAHAQPPGPQPGRPGSQGFQLRFPGQAAVGADVPENLRRVQYAPSYYQTTAQNDPRGAAFEKLNGLCKKLKEAAQEDERREVTAEVEGALGDYFDRDMEYRRAELDRLKKRADDTEAQLQKRQSSRTELIDLQLRSFRYDAEGLDLFGEQGENHAPLGIRRVPAPAMVAVQTIQSGQHRTHYVQPAPGQAIPQQVNDERQASLARITEARSKLTAAENADAEGKALEELKAALGDYFDRDMEFRRAELARVREGLSSMEARLAKRANAKSAIVELQLKMIVNEAGGLGFFSDGDAGGVWPEVSWWKYSTGYPGTYHDRPALPGQLPSPAIAPVRK